MSDEEKYVPIYLEGEAGTLKLKMPKILEESISEKGFSDFNDKRYDDLLNRVEDVRKMIQDKVLVLVKVANKKAEEAQKQQLDVLKNVSKNLATIQEARTTFKIGNNKLKEEIEKGETDLKNNKSNKEISKDQIKKFQSELKDLRVEWKANISQMDYLKRFTQSYKLAGIRIGAISIKHIDGIIKHIVFEFEKLKVKLAELRATGNNKVLNLAKRNKYVSQINFMIGNKSELRKRIAEINTFTISKSETITSIQNEAINDLLDKTSAKLKGIFMGADSGKNSISKSAKDVSKEMSEFEKNLGNIQGFNGMSGDDKKTITNACRIYLAADLINEPQFRKRLVFLKNYTSKGIAVIFGMAGGLSIAAICMLYFGVLFLVLGGPIGLIPLGLSACLAVYSGAVALEGAGLRSDERAALNKSLLAPGWRRNKPTTCNDKKLIDVVKKEMEDAVASADKLKVAKENKKAEKDIADLKLQIERINKVVKEQETSYKEEIKKKDDEIKRLKDEIRALKKKIN